jgi:hypothetical protein
MEQQVMVVKFYEALFVFARQQAVHQSRVMSRSLIMGLRRAGLFDTGEHVHLCEILLGTTSRQILLHNVHCIVLLDDLLHWQLDVTDCRVAYGRKIANTNI